MSHTYRNPALGGHRKGCILRDITARETRKGYDR